MKNQLERLTNNKIHLRFIKTYLFQNGVINKKKSYKKIDQQNNIKELIEKINKISFRKLKHVSEFEMYQIIKLAFFLKSPDLLGNFLSIKLRHNIRKPYPFLRFFSETLTSLHNSEQVEGFLIKIKGRLRGARRKRFYIIHKGKVPINTLEIKLLYNYTPCFTIYGVCSVKI